MQYYTDIITATVSSKGQIVIPQNFREMMGISAGSEVLFKLRSDGAFEVQPVKQPISDIFGICRTSKKNKSVKSYDKMIMKAVLENDKRGH